jgi:hypothetical protein
MSDEQSTRDQSAAPSRCERVTVIDTYEVCDPKDGEIYLWCTDNVLRPARRVKRVIAPRNHEDQRKKNLATT